MDNLGGRYNFSYQLRFTKPAQIPGQGVVVDTFTLTPPRIEQHFGITKGHIHHVDNSFGFADRLPYATPLQGLYSASAGCHPAGSVIGAAGHNAATAVLRDLGVSARS